ncbi:unnamed protein product, partial [Discosporangium mesarthrocarpum]
GWGPGVALRAVRYLINLLVGCMWGVARMATPTRGHAGATKEVTEGSRPKAKGLRQAGPRAAALGAAASPVLEPVLEPVPVPYPRPQSTAYPRPQSTAYPRPQSTAYPRPQSTAYQLPKVEAPTLLDMNALVPVGPTPLAPVRVVEKNPVLGRLLRWVFARVITNRAKEVHGLEVVVGAHSNRDAMSGLLHTVGVRLKEIRLQQVRISGGANLNITGLDLKITTLLWRRFRSFKKPFEVAGRYVLTSGDLVGSPLIRQVVQNMMNATLKKLEDIATDPRPFQKTQITVLRVMAKKSRLVIDGEVVFDRLKVPFQYRTSIGISKKGHVVYLKDAEVFWENVGSSLTLPLVPLQSFDVDIGDHARIEKICIVNGEVDVRARFVLSPIPPLV